ncbi:MAG: alanine--tRNA ligase, partial [Ruminococcaceae bacterium]|nr:alanine--tRNA ligase [Oscillospiraceae bacterium]
FLTEVCDVVISENGDAYPEVREKADYIKKVMSIEEERFNATIDAGLAILSDIIHGTLKEGVDTISGEDVFKLYDTFGFPIDLTREIAEESHLNIDEETFKSLMQQQKVRAREARANISGWSDASKNLLTQFPETEFTGYTDYRTEAKIIGILAEDEAVQSVSEGECTVILDKTPFYGEGGGQVGDTGTIYKNGAILTVYDTRKSDGVYIHLCTVANGTFSVGDTVMADIENMRREAIRRNHSACHLLQAALRVVLGSHVEQAGSYVDPQRVRFDFTHFQALTAEEIRKVEALVNANILVGNGIRTIETDIETAKKEGAMALFGEKYGSTVRMVKMGDFSTELCGGTHCDNTAKIGLFKIVSESSVAAGVRRIEGVTGLGVLELIGEREGLIADTAKALKAQNPNDMAHRAAALQGEISTLKREIDSLNSKLAANRLGSLVSEAKTVGAVKLIAADLENAGIDAARTLCDSIKDKYSDAVAVFAVHDKEKLNFVAACGKDAVSAGAHAGNILKEVSAVTGGKGGGRPDSATSGGRDLDKIADALAAAEAIVAGMLK